MFNHRFFSSRYFPPVWFAPGDETHLTPEETKPTVVEEGGVGGGRKKRKKKDVRGVGIVAPPKLSVLAQMQRDDDEVVMILAMAIGELI